MIFGISLGSGKTKTKPCFAWFDMTHSVLCWEKTLARKTPDLDSRSERTEETIGSTMLSADWTSICLLIGRRTVLEIVERVCNVWKILLQ